MGGMFGHGSQLVDSVSLGGHLLNGSGEAGRGLNGQLGGRWGVGLGFIEPAAEFAWVGHPGWCPGTRHLGPVLSQPHSISTDTAVHVIKPMFLHPLGERTVSLVQAAAITEGVTNFLPAQALLCCGGLDG